MVVPIAMYFDKKNYVIALILSVISYIAHVVSLVPFERKKLILEIVDKPGLIISLVGENEAAHTAVITFGIVGTYLYFLIKHNEEPISYLYAQIKKGISDLMRNS